MSISYPTRPAVTRDRQVDMWRRATRSLPGGASSNFRAWGEETVYVDRGEGARIWDLDGNEYVDLRMGYGTTILGHGDPGIDDYVSERMRRGVSFSLTSEDEVRVAELICEMTFCEMARMTVSGTEATMHAIRVARGYTGRDRIVKFEGQYHGVHDYALISVYPNDVSELGDRSNPLKVAWGRGIPQAIAETVIPVPYNDLATLRRIFEQQGEEIAAVLIEPLLGNAQGILPQPGFLQGVREMTREFGALLIFDEVKTGFRIARGGAAELFGVVPDLATYAKAMGNGYPAAAFGGTREVMSVLPDKVSHGGTYAGNRVAAAAATAVLRRVRDTDALERMDAAGRAIQAGIGAAIERRGLPYVFTGVPAIFGVVFQEELPADYRAWADSDHHLYDDIAVRMRQHGCFPEPDSREPLFVSVAHDDPAIVERVVEGFTAALDEALDARARSIDAARP